MCPVGAAVLFYGIHGALKKVQRLVYRIRMIFKGNLVRKSALIFLRLQQTSYGMKLFDQVSISLKTEHKFLDASVNAYSTRGGISAYCVRITSPSRSNSFN